MSDLNPVAYMAESGSVVLADENMNPTYYHIPLYTEGQLATLREALCWIIDCADIGDAEKIARTALGEEK